MYWVPEQRKHNLVGDMNNSVIEAKVNPIRENKVHVLSQVLAVH